ncbi:N-acetylmuramoyl-L-alanine amidase [Pseudogracilibacillus sp. SE30717A]|uniref:peptidoglycan recognition protein family protein n=1 Tax=Pseudogracilibacillus sp. SE30717A TaxID=3098293 RepID=UPI00300E2D1D
MAAINGVPFKKNLVSSSKYNIKCPYTMNPKKITIHNTDNSATAPNEINYMNGNNNQVSFHVAIDENGVVQGLPYNRNGWHAGDGGNGYGNRNTIGVEMARSYDRNRKTTNLNDPLKTQFEKTFNNTIKFVAQLCVDLGIVANGNNIKQHRDWSGKYCPRKILDDKTWNELLNAIIKEYNRLKGNKTPTKPEAPKDKNESKPQSTYKGNSIVNYLVSLGIDHSVQNRRKLAVEYGVKNYDLSAKKNLELLNKMRSGKKVPASTSKPSTNKDKSTSTSYKVGQKVKIKSSAGKYSRSNTNIPSKYKNKTLTIQQVGKDDVLIKELYSWVKLKDLSGHNSGSPSGSGSKQTSTSKTFKVGQKVKIKSSAGKYSRSNTNIPSKYKNKTLTIQQVGANDILIKELYSWVKKTDVQ